MKLTKTKSTSLLIERVIVNGTFQDIFIDETGTIISVGEDIGRTFRSQAETCIEGGGDLALPGLVNTHTHAAMTLLRGYADDMPLQEWWTQKIWPLEAHLTGDDIYWGTKLACLEMIRSGTIAFNDMYFFMEDAARAVDEMGLCAVLSYGFIDFFSDERREAECRATERLVASIRRMQNPRIRAAVGPHAVYTVSPEGLRWVSEFAAEEKIGIHVHVSETEKEVHDAVSQWKKRPVQILDECGVLTPRTVAAHCCWLDKDECGLLAKRGVHVSHNPASNMKLATGRAMPYHWLSEAGASVTLGTDGCASNNNLDLFEETKIASLLQKHAWNSPTLLPAGEALAMATSAGAKALGFGRGVIASGEPANLILVDSHAVCNTPLHHAASNLVYSCSGNAVKTTICQGRILMKDRVVPGEAEILSGAAKAAAAL
ncbi:MAG TPA: amidohydrolase family protein, partial [Methanolinea sp.]|nr:amidohydrolase family protein [Methanolinea sp.]